MTTHAHAAAAAPETQESKDAKAAQADRVAKEIAATEEICKAAKAEQLAPGESIVVTVSSGFLQETVLKYFDRTQVRVDPKLQTACKWQVQR